MNRRLMLNGADWQLTGWHRNQWRPEISMELGVHIPPAVPAVRAVVPGSVQTDMLSAGWLEDPNVGLNSLHNEWINQREWIFEKTFELPDGWLGDRCELVFEGLDDTGEIHLNGVTIAEFSGMFKPVAVDVTDLIRTSEESGNVLKVIFHASPEVDGQIGHTHRIRRLKSRFNYAWDWCPRMVPVGIWRDVYVHTYSSLKIIDFYPAAELVLEERQGKLRIETTAEVLAHGVYEFRYKVTDPAGNTCAEQSVMCDIRVGNRTVIHEIDVGEVQLWWPNGYGGQPLYNAAVEIWDDKGLACDTKDRRIGFRTAEFIANAQAPRDALPYTAVVNGRRIFIKGVNWVPISPYYGSVTPNQYTDFLGRFKTMNVNLLRVWGGGITEKEAFYDYCDSHGLMVWQEFLQSSGGLDNNPPDDEAYLEQLREVATFAILEKRSHPSLLLWCGGNELMWEGFRPVDDRHANIAMLKSLVTRYDPLRCFLPTSASGPRFCADEGEFGLGVHHDVHGPWAYLGDRRHYSFFNRDDALFRSETGTPGTSRAAAIRKYAGRHSVWPPVKHNPYWVHRGNWWIQWDEMSEWFGSWDVERDELNTYAQLSRYLQKESLRYAAESTRRREPEASGFIVWMGNEPFPNNSNTSLLEFDGMPKPVWYSLKKIFSPVHVSAKYDKVCYTSGELFSCSLFLHCEEGPGEVGVSECAITARIYDVSGRLLAETAFSGRLEAGASRIGDFSWPVIPCPGGLFIVRVQGVNDKREELCSNDYVFTIDASHPFGPLRTLSPAQVAVEHCDSLNAVRVMNTSDVAALGVFLTEEDPDLFVEFDRNDLVLLPQEQVTVHLNRAAGHPPISIEWINAPGLQSGDRHGKYTDDQPLMPGRNDR